jgi:glutathione S-transferase kappa 1
VLGRYEKIWGADFDYVPIYLGGVMHASGNQPPAQLPNKARWFQQEVPRSAKFFGLANVHASPSVAGVDRGAHRGFVQVTIPERFPQQSLHLVRLLRVIKKQHPEKLKPTAELCWVRLALFCSQRMFALTHADTETLS